MSSFVEFSTEEDQAIDLAKCINKLRTKGKEPDNSFVEQCTKLVDSNSFEELLTKLWHEHLLLIAEGSDKDVEGFFSIFLSLLLKQSKDYSENLLRKIVTDLVSNKEESKVSLRLRLLSQVYSMVNNQKVRFEIFMAMLNYCAETNRMDILQHLLKDYEKRVQEWKLEQNEKIGTFKTISNLLEKHGKNQLAFQWLLQYLSMLQGPQASAEESLNSAKKAIVQAIQLPVLYQYDNLLSLASVKALEQKDERIFRLLKIFASETLGAYTEFLAKNGDYLKTLGVNETESLKKMRLLSLATLGAAQNEIPYADVSKTLQIPDSEVESWVIMAIGEEILDAKLDQSRNLVMIKRSFQRVFNQPQWVHLHENLTAWKTNIKSVLQTLHERQQFVLHQAKERSDHK